MAMSETTIASNLNQALDVEIYLFSKFTLNPVLLVNNLSKPTEFLFSKVVQLDSRRDCRLFQYLMAPCIANTVNIL